MALDSLVHTTNGAAGCNHGSIDTVSVVKRSGSSVGLKPEAETASDSEYLAISWNI